MTSSREAILAAVRANAPALPGNPACPGAPHFQDGAPAAFEVFAAALARMGGRLHAPADGESLDEAVRACHPNAKVIVSATPEVAGTRPLPDAARPGELEDVDVGVVRAAFGVAETGSVALGDAEFGIPAVGFLPQHLVVLLDPAEIVPGIEQAYRHAAFFGARYAALMTGPSATADIEGVLIRGAQGIRSLTVVPCARRG